MASKGWEEDGEFFEGIGLVPVRVDSFSSIIDDQIIKVAWRGKVRPVFYQTGPKFLPDKGAKIKIIAYYDDGSIAALSSVYGKGKIVLSGPHPEATDDWIGEHVKNASEWKSTEDLAEDLLLELESK